MGRGIIQRAQRSMPLANLVHLTAWALDPCYPPALYAPTHCHY